MLVFEEGPDHDNDVIEREEEEGVEERFKSDIEPAVEKGVFG